MFSSNKPTTEIIDPVARLRGSNTVIVSLSVNVTSNYYCAVRLLQFSDFSLFSWRYCTRWFSACAPFSWWQCLSTATRSTLWLALPSPCRASPSISWGSICQSPSVRLSSPNYYVSLSHGSSLYVEGFAHVVCKSQLTVRAAVSDSRFFDLLHPVHLLLRTDRDRQEWIASRDLPTVSASSRGPADSAERSVIFCTVHWSSDFTDSFTTDLLWTFTERRDRVGPVQQII